MRNSSSISVVELYLREILYNTLDQLTIYLHHKDIPTLKISNLVDFYNQSM